MSTRDLVSVCVNTFNQEKYIDKTIEGILNQEGEFDLEVIIANDASTDNTDSIIQHYIKNHNKGNCIRYFHHEKNIGMNSNFIFALKKCTGKYIAMCEGDDYWVDKNKIQKQNDFLRNNRQYGLVCSDYDVYYENSSTFAKSFLNNSFSYNEEKDIDIYGYLDKRNYIRTLTVMYRAEYIKKYLLETEMSIQLSKSAADVPTYLFILCQSKAKYFPYSTAVYRVSEGTASRLVDFEKRSDFKKDLHRIILYFAVKYGLNRRTLKKEKINKILTDVEYFQKKELKHKVFINLIKLCLLGKFSKKVLQMLFNREKGIIEIGIIFLLNYVVYNA